MRYYALHLVLIAHDLPWPGAEILFHEDVRTSAAMNEAVGFLLFQVERATGVSLLVFCCFGFGFVFVLLSSWYFALAHDDGSSRAEGTIITCAVSL